VDRPRINAFGLQKHPSDASVRQSTDDALRSQKTHFFWLRRLAASLRTRLSCRDDAAVKSGGNSDEQMAYLNHVAVTTKIWAERGSNSTQ
jgi:hypothetical protein